MTELPILNALLYAAAGMLLFAAAFRVLIQTMPGEFWTEIREKQNVALAIVTAGALIGLATIISSAVH